MGVGPRWTPAQRSSLAYVLSTSGESRSRVRIRVPLRAQIESASLSEPAALPPGVASVLAVLSSSAVVLDNEDRVLQASAAARAFGLVSGDQLVVQELVALARQVRRDGEIREGELDVSTTGVHRRVTSLAVRAAPLDAAVGGGGLVLLLAETVEDAADDPEAVRRFASRMRQEAARLTNLVQDMITLSRIQAAEPIPDPVPVALDAVVAEALDRCRMKASARGIELVAVGEHGLSVLGDEDLLVTALRNLLENAVAYSPDKTRVDVSTRHAADDAVEISVADQGIGIPERDLERIFERFYRVDPARSRATGGTGLGLAIVKHVTAAHGGKVTVVSSEGAGSTFTLMLPLRIDAVTVRRHRTGDGAIRQEAVK